MYLGVDVGGTKTLLGVLNDEGVIKEKRQFPTPKKYDHWLLEIKNIAHHLEHKDFFAGGVGLPGRIDRRHGRGISMGNLGWKNVNTQYEIENIFGCPIVLENDAKLAGLSESMLLKDSYAKVVYITISTGIGISLLVNGQIDTNIGDGGGKTLLIEHNGKNVPWESFASGRAIVERYGKRAEDIHDEATWRKISRDLATGLLEVIAVLEPEVIVVGGSVGAYFDRFGSLLKAELKKHQLPMIKMPELRQAQRPTEAVVYGCYDLAKQKFSHARVN